MADRALKAHLLAHLAPDTAEEVIDAAVVAAAVGADRTAGEEEEEAAAVVETTVIIRDHPLSLEILAGATSMMALVAAEAAIKAAVVAAVVAMAAVEGETTEDAMPPAETNGGFTGT